MLAGGSNSNLISDEIDGGPVWGRKFALDAETVLILFIYLYMRCRLEKNVLGFSHVFSANLSYILSNILYRKFPIFVQDKQVV